MTGYIHSIESFGTVDGPGVRMVVFLKGCPMRCLYCHNPDTWEPGGGTEMTVDEILNQYETNKGFYKNGGLTVTGGEPLVQLDFVITLFNEAKKKGIHTCLDTSGATFQPENSALIEKFDRLCQVTDLVMLDIKHIDPEEHEKLCGRPLEPILSFARYLDEREIPLWIRHVIVPGITYDQSYLYRLGLFLGALKQIRALDVLPYHDMGKSKYENLGIVYPLKDVKSLGREEAAAARQVILRGMRDSRES